MLRRIFPAVYAIGTCVIIVFIALAVLQFNQIRSELEREKISVLVDRMAEPFESAALIGLPLATVRNTDVLLERARQLDPAINAVQLIGEDGTLLASVPAGADNLVAIRRAVGESPGIIRSWSGETDEGFYSGVWIRDSSGRKVGGVMIIYSGQGSRTQSWAMVGQLLVGGLLFVLVMMPVIWLALRWSLQRSIAGYDAVEADIQAFERNSWRMPELPKGEDDSGAAAVNGALGRLLIEVEAGYRREISSTGTVTRAAAASAPLPQTRHSLRGRIVVVMTAVIAAAVLLYSFLILAAFDRAVEPELESRTTLIGALIRSEMQRTLELGIPITGLRGLTPYVEEVLRDFTEIASIAIVSADGTAIAQAATEAPPRGLSGFTVGQVIGIQASTTELPVLVRSDVVGLIRVQGDPLFVEVRLRDVLLDVAVLAMAMLLIGVETAIAMASATVWKPHALLMQLLSEQRQGRFIHVIEERGPPTMRRLAARLNDYTRDITKRASIRDGAELRIPSRLESSDPGDIRLPLFLFAFGSEITASFLPLFAAAASRPDWLSVEAAAAAPLVTYLICLAVLSPFAGRLSQRFGATRLFLVCIPPVIAALSWMALSQEITHIALARGLIALFYALATVSAQQYALRADGPASGGNITGVFFGLVFGGAFCGSIVGGILADRFGYPIAMLSGTIFTLAAGVAAFYSMRGPASGAVNLSASVETTGWRPVDMRRFSGVFIGLAIPLSVVSAAFIWYFIPLTLAEEGLRQADIARVVMTYYLAAILVGPLVVSDGEKRRRAGVLTVSGAVLAGTALLSLAFLEEVWATASVVVLVGIGHTLMRSPMYGLATQFAGSSPGPLILLRLFERLAAIAGLLLVAGLNSINSMASLPALLGVVVVGGALLFLLSATPLTRIQEAQAPCSTE